MDGNMDVYRAVADFKASRKHSTCLSFHKGDAFEVLEKGEGDNSWWGVRRLRDNQLGWVPSQYLEYERQETEDRLPNDYTENRKSYVKKLGAMQQGTEHKLPDIYKVPPVSVTSFDEWRKTETGSDEDPEPDYSGSEEDGLETHKENGASDELQQIGGMKLSRDDWQKILSRAEGDPDPDYEEDDEGQAARRQQYASRKDLEGFVAPQKPQNPVVGSREHQDLHRELMWNKKRGIDVLHRKTELKKELDRRQTKKKDQERKEDPNNKTIFEKLLDERAEKLKHSEKKEAAKTETGGAAEFLRVHSKIKRPQPEGK